MLEWLREHQGALWWLAGLSVVTLVAAVILLPVLLARMPADYFVRRTPPRESWRGRHPLLRAALHAAKNALGGVLALAGIALLFLPGQGLVTILAGVALLDFPGKRHVELRVVRVPGVLRAVNWLRGRAGKPPLLVDGVPGQGARDPAQPES
jgi:hypothetical protein